MAFATQDFSNEDAGYHKTLKPRQIQMIAIDGAIGTGLFMGAGDRLHGSGPALILVYAPKEVPRRFDGSLHARRREPSKRRGTIESAGS